MVEAYQKLLVGSEGCTQSYFELVLKCDGKFKVQERDKDEALERTWLTYLLYRKYSQW